MPRKIILTLIILICVTTLMSGCMETTTIDELGIRTHNILTQETITKVNHFKDGEHVTGIIRISTDNITCYDLYSKMDKYHSDGSHMSGYRTLKGCGNDVEWYNCLIVTRDGYKTQYLNGYDNAKWKT